MRIDQDVLEVLSTCSVGTTPGLLPGEGSQVFLPPRQLDRKLYLRVNEVLEALGGKWNRKAKAHTFVGDVAVKLDDVIVTGEVDRPADFGFFPTPPALALHVASRARLHDVEGRAPIRVLESSAGQGALVTEVLRYSRAEVTAVELLPANFKLLKALEGPRLKVLEGDFLKMSRGELGAPFNRVVMNPPFARQQDIAHVLYAHSMLAPGGRLVSVMSGGVLFRSDRRSVDFRLYVDRVGGSIEALPDSSFKASGTEVRTCLAVLPSAEALS